MPSRVARSSLLLVPLLAAAPALAAAQPADVPAPVAAAPATLRGMVVSTTNGAPVVGAVVRIEGSSAPPVLTNELGEFELPATVGQVLIIEAEGFQLGYVGIEPFDSRVGAERLTVGLVSDDAVGETIEITDRAPPPPAPGAAKLDREELATLPGTGGDVLAGLDILPGVTTPPGGFGGNGVIIRGSSPEDSRILLDGFDIPQLYHLFGRSIIPTEAIAGLEYLPGGFDVRYGRASSGIVAIRSRGGENEVQGNADVSIIDAGIVGSGPITDTTRVLASFRRSYVDSWLPSVLPDEIGLVAAPRFYDGLLRVDWRASDHWQAAFTLVGSDDKTALVGASDQTDDEFEFELGTRFIRGIASAEWRGTRGRSLELGASVLAQSVYFGFGNGNEFQFLDVQQQSFATRAEYSQKYDTALGLRDVLVRVGGELDPRRNNISLSLQRGPDEGQADDGREGETIGFDNTVWVTDVGAWAALEGDLSSKIRMVTGLRLDGAVRNRAFPLHPRGELRVTPDAKTTVRLVAGRYTRPPANQEELLYDDLGVESATQVMLGGERKFGTGGSVQLTVYDTERTDLIARAENGDLMNQGRGRTYGAEVLATYRADRVFGWLSYTLSRSTLRDTATSADKLFDYDQTHDLVAAGSYKTKNRKWQFGAKFTLRTGQPYTPVLGAIYDADADTYYRINAPVNSDRLATHHQLDLRIDRTWAFQRWKFSAFLDVQNVYLNDETISYQYNYDYTERADVKSLPIIPTIGLRGEL
jgi:hypothetical protein